MMPWRLLAFIAGITIALFFVGFNLENRCDVSLAVVTLRGVPVVVTILSAYLLGLLSALVVELGRRRSVLGRRSNGRLSSIEAPRDSRSTQASLASMADEPLPPDQLPPSGGSRAAHKPRRRPSRGAE